MFKAPSTRIRIFSNPQLFLSGHGYLPHASGELDSGIRKKTKSALRSGKNKSATNPITCWRANPDIFESDDVKSVSSLSPAQRVGRTGQISRHYLALRRMLWRHFSTEQPWVLEWIRIPSDACGRANSIWIRYVWTGKFLNPERKSFGLNVWPGPKSLINWES